MPSMERNVKQPWPFVRSAGESAATTKLYKIGSKTHLHANVISVPLVPDDFLNFAFPMGSDDGDDIRLTPNTIHVYLRYSTLICSAQKALGNMVGSTEASMRQRPDLFLSRVCFTKTQDKHTKCCP